ncbi:hypothetical protein D3C76_1826940 [compost metagenome]
MPAGAVDQDIPALLEPLIDHDRNTVIQAIGMPTQREVALFFAACELFTGNTDGILAHGFG